MKVFRYSQWDGTQDEFSLDADRALEHMSDLMMEGLSAREAMDFMQRFGFELAGMDFRVMGMQELLEDLARQARDLYRQYNMDHALDEMRELYDRMVEAEQDTLQESEGFESSAMNDFMQRRHAPSQSLSESVEQFDGYEFRNPEAAAAYEQLKDELERMKELEQFLQERGRHFRGDNAAGYETAQQVREQLQQMEQLARDLAEGNVQQIDPEQLREMLGEDASRSLIMIRDLEQTMRDRGYLRTRDGEDELTPMAIRRIGAHALAQVYTMLRKGRWGDHDTAARGVASPRPDETRPYKFGDPLNLHTVKTLMNGMRRAAADPSGGGVSLPIRLSVDDLEIQEMDFNTQTTTVLLLDLSWSMSWEGRFPAAKRVAMAMDQLIRTQFPRDHFFIVGFSTRAREVPIRELPEITWDPGDPFTNLQEGLMVAERLIIQHPSPSSHILVITDGQPTAYFLGEELHVEWPNGRGGISPRAVAATLQQVERITRRNVTINTFMLHDSPELVGFVERMTEINRGRALFTDPAHLGSYVLVDHMKNRARRRR